MAGVAQRGRILLETVEAKPEACGNLGAARRRVTGMAHAT